MLKKPPTVAVVAPGDRERLSEFTCSTGRAFEDEVQDWIREHAFDEAESARAEANYRLVVFDVGEDLAAVAAYHVGEHDGDAIVVIRAVALSTDYQGEEIEGRGKLADFVATAIANDAATRPTALPVARAKVHRDNARSLAFCERMGLRTHSLDETDPDYLLCFGKIGPSEA
jgi:hypothetical protein